MIYDCCKFAARTARAHKAGAVVAVAQYAHTFAQLPALAMADPDCLEILWSYLLSHTHTHKSTAEIERAKLFLLWLVLIVLNHLLSFEILFFWAAI